MGRDDVEAALGWVKSALPPRGKPLRGELRAKVGKKLRKVYETDSTMTVGRLAVLLDRPPSTLYTIMGEAGVDFERMSVGERRTLTRVAVARYNAGDSLREIASDTGRAYGTIRTLLKQAGVELWGTGGSANRDLRVARRTGQR